MTCTRSCLLLAFAFGCSRSHADDPNARRAATVADTPSADVAPASASTNTTPTSTPLAEVTPASTPPSAPASPVRTPSPEAPAEVSAEPPASFEKGQRETIGEAVGLGCEPRSYGGWLELLCRKKNGTGGHPVRAVLHGGDAATTAAFAAPSPAATVHPETDDARTADGGDTEVHAGERGELRVVLPLQDGKKNNVTLEWTDTRYELALDGTRATLTWAGAAIPHRRTCQMLLDQNQKLVADAQKGDVPARLAPAETRHLPKFGQCQPAGLGSWALSLTSLRGEGDGATRSLVFELAVVRVDLDGRRVDAPFGSIEVAPGGLEIGPLRAYDYDDDGNDELIVPYEIKALASTLVPPAPSPLWSLTGSTIVPYENAPAVAGGVGIEQLDFDMRPDLGTYGPFVAWLPSDCGPKSCPARITGPKFFFHSLAGGSFSANDDAARAAIRRACVKKPSAIVAGAGNAVNLAKTAENLVCARVAGESSATLRAELASKRQDLCGEKASCPVATVFETWLSAPLPVELASEARAAAD